MGTNLTFNERLRKAARPRALRMIRLHEKGKTWKCIGAMFGISGSAAQALAARHMEKKA